MPNSMLDVRLVCIFVQQILAVVTFMKILLRHISYMKLESIDVLSDTYLKVGSSQI